VHRFSSTVVAGLSAVLALCAGDGIPPRASSSDYPVHQEAPNATFAAALVPSESARKIFPPEVSKHYVIVEVAVLPHAGETVHIDSFDFNLKVGDGQVSYPHSPAEIASVWAEKSDSQPTGKTGVTGETGVVYTSGGDTATGRAHGWGTYAGVGVGKDDSTPPRPPSVDSRQLEAGLNAKALPEGPATGPVAGYLFFAMPSKKRKGEPMELRYSREGVRVILPIPAK